MLKILKGKYDVVGGIGEIDNISKMKKKAGIKK